MATSRSTKATSSCTATASIFSGRPDAEWRVAETTARRLRALWDELELSRCAPPTAPSLGYRGVILVCGPRERWVAYGGVVVSGDDRRRDPERKFERALLESAPASLIPRALIGEIGL